MFFLTTLLLFAIPIWASRNKKPTKISTISKEEDNLARFRYFLDYMHIPGPLRLMVPPNVQIAYSFFSQEADKLIKKMDQSIEHFQEEINFIEASLPYKRELYTLANSVNQLLSSGYQKSLMKYQEMKDEVYKSNSNMESKNKDLDSLLSFIKVQEDLKQKALVENDPKISSEVRLRKLEENFKSTIHKCMFEAVIFQELCIQTAGKYDLFSKISQPPFIESLGSEGFESPLMTRWIEDFFHIQLCIGREGTCNDADLSSKDFIPRFITANVMSSINEISENAVLAKLPNETIKRLVSTLKNQMKKWKSLLQTFDSQFDDFHRMTKFYNVDRKNYLKMTESFAYHTMKIESGERALEELKNDIQIIVNQQESIKKGLEVLGEESLFRKIDKAINITIKKISLIKKDLFTNNQNHLNALKKGIELGKQHHSAFEKSSDKIYDSATVKAEKFIRNTQIFQERVASTILEINNELRRLSNNPVPPVNELNFNDENSFNHFISGQKSVFDILLVYLPQPDEKAKESNIIVMNESEENVKEETPENVEDSSANKSKKKKKKKKAFRPMSLIDSPKYCFAPQKVVDRRVSKDTLKVATFNAQWLFLFSAFDKDTFWENSNEAMDHFHLVVKYIEQLNADILLLQEVEDCRVLEAISKVAPHLGYSPYLVENRDSSFGHHVGLLSRVPPTHLDFIDAYKKGEEGEKVGVAKNLVAHFKVQNSSGKLFPIMLVGAHLIAGDRTLKRSLQAEIITEYIKERRGGNGEGLIVLGDMNDHDARLSNTAPFSKALRILSQNGVLKNVLEGIADRWMGTIHGGVGMIDHILLSNDLQYSNASVHTRDAWRTFGLVSDHAAVSCVIHLD